MVKIHIIIMPESTLLELHYKAWECGGKEKKHQICTSIIQASNVSATSESFAGDTVVTSQVKTGN